MNASHTLLPLPELQLSKALNAIFGLVEPPPRSPATLVISGHPQLLHSVTHTIRSPTPPSIRSLGHRSAARLLSSSGPAKSTATAVVSPLASPSSIPSFVNITRHPYLPQPLTCVFLFSRNPSTMSSPRRRWPPSPACSGHSPPPATTLVRSLHLKSTHAPFISP